MPNSNPGKVGILVIDLPDAGLQCATDVRNQSTPGSTHVGYSEVHRVLDHARASGMPIIVVDYEKPTHTAARTGENIRRGASRTVVKSGIDAFDGTDLEKILQEFELRVLILIGADLHHCVRVTAQTAKSLGFDPIVHEPLCFTTSTNAQQCMQTLHALYRELGQTQEGEQSVFQHGIGDHEQRFEKILQSAGAKNDEK